MCIYVKPHFRLNTSIYVSMNMNVLVLFQNKNSILISCSISDSDREMELINSPHSLMWKYIKQSHQMTWQNFKTGILDGSKN